MNVDIVVEGLPEAPIQNEFASFAAFILKKLKIGGKAIAQVDNATGKSVTYDEIRKKAIKLAIGLRELGVKKGDVVAISSENRFEFTVTAIAVMSLGAINATLNILYTRMELIHAMNISKPKMIFCSPSSLRNVIDAITEVSSVEKLFLYGNDKLESTVMLFDELIDDGVDTENFKVVDVDASSHPLAIFCSSGTTGLPKGVILTHHNFTICAHHLKDRSENLSMIDHCMLIIIPWFHSYGFITQLMSLVLKYRLVFMVQFEEEAYLRAIQKYKVTLLTVVPPLMVFFAKHPLVDKYDLSSLKEIICGAAPLSKELQLAVTARIGVKNIKQGYGMTETTFAVLITKDDGIHKYGSCGTVVPGTKVKVVDLKTKKSLGPNREGELCFKGKLTMYGYMGDASSTEEIFDSDGWLHTGDVGYYDEDGYFYIVDRIKELIKYKGFQVPPAELEALLLTNPNVKDAGVVGLPDADAGELPLAFVVLQPGAKSTEEDIKAFIAKRVSKPKRLHGGVRFVDAIPINPSGKILRRELRDMLKTHMKSKL